MQKKHRNTLIIFFLLYALTFLPNFGIFNSLTWVGPLPLPLFWVLLINLINTIIVIYVYKQFFKPFAKRIEQEMTEEETERGSTK
jgi:high-affinity nickel permease